MKIIDHHTHIDFQNKQTIKDFTHYLLSTICLSTGEQPKVILELNTDDYIGYIVNNIEYVKHSNYFRILNNIVKNVTEQEINCKSLKVLEGKLSENNQQYVDDFEYLFTIGASENRKYKNVYNIHYCDTYVRSEFIREKTKILKISTLRQYFNFIKNKLDSEEHLIGLKLGIAYWRSLKINVKQTINFENMHIIDFLKLENSEDIILNYIIAYASDNKLPIQIHCGYLEMSASENLSVERTNPLLLEGVIKAYPNTKFILLHCGFPFVNEQIALGRTFSNVYIDLSWITFYSPVIYNACLKVLMEMIPISKIIGFGSDVNCVEVAYELKTEFIKTIQEMYNDDFEEIINMIAYKNILAIYNLGEKNENK